MSVAGWAQPERFYAMRLMLLGPAGLAEHVLMVTAEASVHR